MPRKLASIGSVLAIALLGGACTKIEARDLIREGNSLYKEARYEEAIAKYDESMKLEPDGVTVLWNRAAAAEAIVLRLKDAQEPKQTEARKKFADIALADLKEWHTALEVKTEQDDTDYEDHRLAVLSADQRCDDLVAHWTEKHQSDPQDQGLYTVIARTFEETCGEPAKAEEWFIKRTEDFPDSPKAYYALAVRRFEPLFPDPETALPFNPNIGSSDRTKIAQDIIDLLNKATAIEPKYRDPYVWRSMAYNQIMFARQFQDPPELPEDKLEALLARNDSMLAWRETKAVCDIDSIPDCPLDPIVSELLESPTKFPGDLHIYGKSVGESVRELEPNKWSLKVELKDPPNAPAPVEGEGEGEGEEQAAPQIEVHYTFVPPAVEEGEPPADITEHVTEITDTWKASKSVMFKGKITSRELFEVVEAPIAGCCPPPPLTPAEEEADAIQRAELETLIREMAEQEAEQENKKKKKKKKR